MQTSALDRQIAECVDCGRAIADVIGDPFGSAAEYTALDAGQLFMPLFPPPPMPNEMITEAIVVAAQHRLITRFHVRCNPRTRHAILKLQRQLLPARRQAAKSAAAKCARWAAKKRRDHVR